MKNIHNFFNTLRINGGAIWLEVENIKLFVPKIFQNQETKDFIANNRSEIISVLRENDIYSKENFSGKTILKSTNQDEFPLSFSQERLWFIEEYERGTNAYHIPLILELKKGTDKNGIKWAISQIVVRHAVLRSTIRTGEGQKGVQVVHDKPLTIEEVHIEKETLDRTIKEDINRPFALNEEYPVRVKLYTITSGDNISNEVILINIHHIASDGWSMDIFQREMKAYYEAYVSKDTHSPLPELEIQYKDYAVWQRSYLTEELLSDQLNYWKHKLSGYENLTLPTDYSRPGQVDYKGSTEVFTLNKETSNRLRTLTRERGTTLHNALLSSVSIFLGKYTGAADIITGSPIANRHHRQTEGLIGFFVNSQVNRVILKQGQSFEDLIDETHQDQMLSQLHQDLPFAKLVDGLGVERDLSRHPIFQVMFSVQGFGKSEKGRNESEQEYTKAYHGLSTSVYDVEKFDISIHFDNSQEELTGYIGYATSLFKRETITRFIAYYQSLLERLMQEPQRSYSELSLVNEEEYQKIIYDWNKTGKEYPKGKMIHTFFEEQVARTPDNIAVVCDGYELTYNELNVKSNQLAYHIRDQYRQRTGKDLQADTLIPLFLERSPETIIGILGVLKAGGAYVPIDPVYPNERIDYLLTDTKAELILTQRHLAENGEKQLPADKLLYIGLSENFYQEETTGNLPSRSTGKDLAYVIYTSGTTGKPKGVMVEHDAVINYVNNVREILSEEIQNVDFSTNTSFDLTVTTTLCPLLLSKIIFVYSGSLNDTDKYVDHVIKNKIDFIKSTPSLLANLSLEHFSNYKIKQAFIGGEKLEAFQLTHLAKYIDTIIDEYGPTEATVGATYKRKVDRPEGIGRPYFNYKLYVLDQNKIPVPIGVTGELYIGGAGLSRGYLNNEILTKQRFINNPFATEKDKENGDTRLYKTGDLVRWVQGGELEFIGRNDEQVKIRGYRIELGEIEHALQQIPGVKQSCILARERETASGKSKYLVGYYVMDQGAIEVSTSTILEKLSTVLPDYMIPAAVVAVDAFPLTINGKLDKRALPDPEFANNDSYAAPKTETEKVLSRIWTEVLGLERVGREDNFFRIGGDSILSMQVSSRIRQLGFSCQVKDIFTHKTISQLSAYLDHRAENVAVQSEQGLLSGELGLLPIQQWFFDQVDNNQFIEYNHWNQSFLIKVPALALARLTAAVRDLVAYHDALRINYIKAESWHQFYQSDVAIPEVKTLDVKNHTQEEIQDILTEWQRVFDIESGPLFRIGYLRGYEDGSARIYVAIHHLIVDTVSWRIIVEDLKRLYEGKKPEPKGSSYRQWVKCVKKYADQHAGEVQYWSAQLKGLPSYTTGILHEPSAGQVELSGSSTQRLLQEAAGAYHTEINDLLLTALAYALRELNGKQVQAITMEGHGREPVDTTIDHSHTVGWYTTMFPVRLELGGTIGDSICNIKEGLRAVPNKGIGYGAFAVREESGYGFSDLPSINFNYLGQFSRNEGDWQIVSEGSGQSRSLLNKGHYVIDINGMVSAGKLTFHVVTRLGEAQTEKLVNSFEIHLKIITEFCIKQLSETGSSYTPSDFSFVKLSQSLISSLQQATAESGNSIVNIYPANSLQQGFIHHALTQKNDDAYRVQVLYDYQHGVDVEKYIQAWQLCIRQYPILRTAFNWEEYPVQVVYREGYLNSYVHDISGISEQELRDERIREIQREDRSHGFDLTRPALLRLHIIKQTEDCYTVLKSEHHSISDGWSGPVLLDSVHRYYRALTVGERIEAKEDTAYLRAQEYISANKARLSSYWSEIISAIESTNEINSLLSRSIDFNNYQHLEEPATSTLRISGPDYGRLKKLIQKEGITMNAIVQFVWHKVLAVYSGQLTSVVGTTVSGRDLPVEGIESSVGLYINTLPLMVDWNNKNSILSQIHHIQERVTGLNAHSFADLAKLQRNGERLFQSLLVFENYPLPKQDAKSNLRVRVREAIEKVSYPLSILAHEHDDALMISLQYDGKYLTKERAEAHIKTMEHILSYVREKVNLPHSYISLLQPQEYNKIIYEWNHTERTYPKDKTIHQLFEEQAARTPDNVALVFEGERLTYKELNVRSNQLARHIRSHYRQRAGKELVSDTLIPLLLDRSLETVVGILGVLKAGGAYVPIDPGYPQDRIDYILRDTEAFLVLSQKHLMQLGKVKLPEDKVLFIDLSEDFYIHDTSDLPSNSISSDLAYVIYTSGTTGKPKGVMIEHRSLHNLVSLQKSDVGIKENSRVIQYASYVFDASVWEIFSALSYGATLFVIGSVERQDATKLTDFLVDKKISLALLPPTLLNVMPDAPLEDLTTLLVGGDLSSKELMGRWSRGRNLINAYGPTESTVCASMNQYAPGDSNTNIGKPLGNISLYVLDHSLNPVPLGVVGELYIGGASLARGYLNNESLTRERFIDNPFATEADKAKGYTRLYKTGDLVRWLADGRLEYVGRNDDQVKIRGHRIEIGEIEHALQQIPGVRESCVLVRERGTASGKSKYLVGYYAVKQGVEVITDSFILHQLSKTLPDYMIPSVLVAVESFSLTINGKLDKRALPDPDFADKELYIAPATETEKTVCKIWEEVLGIERVGVADNFFRAGGDSILAIQTSHRMSKALGMTVSIADIFKHKTISAILSHQEGFSKITIPKVIGSTAVLSFAQERLWFIEQYEEGTNAYHIPLIFELSEDIDKDGIKYAISQIVLRHEVLRSTIATGEDQKGIQEVHDKTIEIEEISLEEEDCKEAIGKDIHRPFNLSKEYPIRVKLYKLISRTSNSSKEILLINMHHIASDGWSMDIFQKEMRAYYEAYVSDDTAFRLPGLAIQYKDYAVWQRSHLTGPLLAKQLGYWKERLSGYENLSLPADYRRPDQIDYKGASHVFTLSKNTSDQLRTLAKQRGTTLHSILLSSVSILLGKYAGADDIITGSPIANRHHWQTEELIGFFVNSQVNRVTLTQGQSFEELIEATHQDQVLSQLHQDLPFEMLIDELGLERDPSRHPIFQVMFGVQSFGKSGKQTHVEGKKFLKPYQPAFASAFEVEKFDLSIFFDDSQEEVLGYMGYATSLFKEGTIVRLVGYYQSLLERLLNDPKISYSALSLLGPEEYQKIIYDWNQTDKHYPNTRTIQELFEQQVSRTPEAIALVYEGEQLTYHELNAKSNQLANHIRCQYRQRTGNELTPDTLIALFTDRSLEMVVCILAVLKAGGAYVPIDPAYPQERIDYILEDTGAVLVLCQKHLSTGLSHAADQLLTIDLAEDLYKEEKSENLFLQSRANDLAYVIYTSGTTGKPKGVMIEHKAILNTIDDLFQIYHSKGNRCKVSAYTSYVFDVSVSEIITSLVQGLELHILSAQTRNDSVLLSTYLIRHGINLAYLPPVMLSSLPKKEYPDLKQLIYAGEPCDKQTAAYWSGRVKLYNYYGPTEVSVYGTGKQIRADEVEQIGVPIQNTKAYVLDRDLNPLPVGVTGELHMGGAGLARGYLNNEVLTRERFIPNPFATEADKRNGYTRLYKTGDLVRWLADGHLEYLGRNDDQVKIRGYRIELGEIEHALQQIPGVKQSCVLARTRETASGKSKYLVAYYVAEQGTNAIISDEIIRQLSAALPDYMIPSAFVALESFPLTINGKLDKRALPDPDFVNKQSYTAPSTETEKAVTQIWSEVLGVERIGVDDNFFRIGGDSILSIQVSSRIRQLGYACQVKDIFDHKTIARLSTHLDKKTQRAAIQSEQGLLDGALGLLPIQQWFVDQVQAGLFEIPHHWNQSFLIRVPEIGEEKLTQMVSELVKHHDIFRVRYQRVPNAWTQYYTQDTSIPEIKRLKINGQDEDLLTELLTKWQSGFDLEKGPLYQIGYLHGYEDGSARIYVAMHHLIVDAVSWRIIVEDLKCLYEGKALPIKGSSYRQWVGTIIQYPERHAEESQYWAERLAGLPVYLAGVSHERSVGQVELPVHLTQRLLQEASGAYRTQINDLLLTALAYALNELNHEEVQGITLEGHGRESIDPSIDHSHTVGWYTSMYPVRLELGTTIGESICKIKEELRAVPNKGIGFGAFAVQKDSAYRFSNLPPISFNYLGQFGAERGRDWQITPENSGESISPLNRDRHLININGGVKEGKLGFAVVTRLGIKETATLAASFQAHLKSIIEYCIDQIKLGDTHYTPSDFTTVKLSQSLINDLQASARASGNSIEHIYPANSLQQGFIHHVLTQEDDDAYRVQVAYDYHRQLDTEKYIEAWKLCIRQYPILRTGFNWEEYPIQVIYREGNLDYYVHDISTLSSQALRDKRIREIQQEDRLLGFDLRRPTLLRLHIIKQSEDYYTVVKCEHHSISDGWSGPIVLSSLHRYYQNLLSGGRIDVKEDTAYLRAQEYISSNKPNLSAYWSDVLSEVEGANEINALLSSPIDFRSYRKVEESKATLLQVSGSDYEQLKKVTQQEGITMNVIVQFVWHKLLQVYSGQHRSIVGTTVSGRDLPIEGIESSVGLYINTLPLVVDWDNKESILSQLHRIHKGITELNTRSFADLAKLQQDGQRLFHTLLIFENYPLPKDEGHGEGDIKISMRAAVEKVDYPLSMVAYEYDNTLTIKFQYDGKLVNDEYAAAHVRTMERILDYVRENSNLPHNQMTLLQAEEYQKIIYDWNQADEEYPKDKTIQGLFEEQAARTPDNVAFVFEGKQLTYRELNERSNQLARRIRNFYKHNTGGELQADTFIALCVDRSLEMIVGILGILKAGGAYVPIDPEYPQERIDYMLEDTSTALVLTQQHLAEGLSDLSDRLFTIDLSDALYEQESTENLSSQNKPTDLAYVIYTSGTTGKPKGVMVEHHQVLSFAIDNNFIDYEKATVIGGISNYAFDGSVFDIFFSLINGKKLILVSKDDLQEPLRLDKALAGNHVDTIFITTALFNSLVLNEASCLHRLKQILFGGEACNIEIVNKFKRSYPATSLIHVYGPTENIVYSSYCHLNDYNTTRVAPIGSRLSDKKLYVLDPGLNPVPIGVAGELYVGGVGVCRGYLNNEILTKERFIHNPFATESDRLSGYTRLYKTGDLVRWLPDGNIEYLGRNDDQVKIRGHRIELGEIEHALQQIPGIRQSCVLARERKTPSGKSKYLVGYYVKEEGAKDIKSSDLLKQLSGRLPDYMIPGTLVSLESLPLTINGKLDKRALPDPDFAEQDTYAIPTTETEEALAKVWAEVLGLPQVSIEDNFFRIGGDSILAMQLSTRIRKLGYHCQVKDILTHKTISRLSTYLDNNKVQGEIQSEQGLLTGALGLLPIQRWFANQIVDGTLGAPHHWNQSFLIRVPEIGEEKLSQMLGELVRYHDIFRVRYEKELNDLKQYYTQEVAIPCVKRLDVSGLPEHTLMEILTEWQSSFDLQKGPLYQFGYLYGYEDGSARIFVAMHHLIVDAVSWRIIAEDLKTLHEGKKLQMKGSSYRQWVTCIQNYSEKHAGEADYWAAQIKGLPVCDTAKWHAPTRASVRLSEKLTQNLLHEAPGAYHTEINDLLLTSLAYALKELNGQDVQGVTLEGHGREPIDPTVEHSHTVGWYTSMYPIRLELGVTIGESIGKISEGLRSIPNKGIGFGAFAAANETGYGFAALPPISFNYLGQFGAGEGGDWQIAAEKAGQSVSSSNQDHNAINIYGMVTNGTLEFEVATCLGATQTNKLANSLTLHLTNVIEHCLEQPEKEELHPASHLQSYWYGIYKDGLKHPAHGMIIRTMRHVDKEIFSKALNTMVRRHESLRTTFTEQNEKLFQRISPPSDFSDLVLFDDVSAEKDKQEKISVLIKEMANYSFDYQKEYSFKCKLIEADKDNYTVIMVIDHIIHDGIATRIVEEELFKIYEAYSNGKPNPLETLKLQFKDYVTFQREHYSGEKLAFHRAWVRKIFKDLPQRIKLKPIYSAKSSVNIALTNGLGEQVSSNEQSGGIYSFRVSEDILKEIQRISAEMEISTYNFMLASYCIFLNKICVQNDFVIDSPTSGRNNEDFSGIVGCLGATLSLRIKLREELSFREFALLCNEHILESMDHIHFHNDAFDLGVEWNHIATQMNLTSDHHHILEHFDPYYHDMEFIYFDFTCIAHEMKNGMTIKFVHKHSFLEKSLIPDMADIFLAVIKMSIHAPDTKLKDWEKVVGIIDSKNVLTV